MADFLEMCFLLGLAAWRLKEIAESKLLDLESRLVVMRNSEHHYFHKKKMIDEAKHEEEVKRDKEKVEEEHSLKAAQLEENLEIYKCLQAQTRELDSRIIEHCIDLQQSDDVPRRDLAFFKCRKIRSDELPELRFDVKKMKYKLKKKLMESEKLMMNVNLSLASNLNESEKQFQKLKEELDYILLNKKS